ncbi:EFR1 family ferrodoxin [Prevotella pectinovora]|uniref:EFR1 family ferrodoxin n=1 Tax=Prevotella pectinovora TaxID=1602169 RepID=UPI00307E6157
MILYLSGTGNTRWVAESIARMTGDERVVDVASLCSQPLHVQLNPGEPLGIFFPVHGWRPPMLLRRVLSEMTLSVGSERNVKPYVYSVCTVGDTVGESMDILRSDLKKQGVSLDAVFDVRMPNTYVGLPFMDVDKGKVVSDKLHEAQPRMEFIAEKIRERANGAFMRYLGRWKRINSRLLGEAFVRKLVTDRYFHVEESLCVSCGKCVASCPVGNMSLDDDGMPQWNHDGSCLTCFACYHNCPRHAIRFGSVTDKKGQYVFDPKRA